MTTEFDSVEIDKEVWKRIFGSRYRATEAPASNFRVEAGLRAAEEFDSKITSLVLASIKITDGFLKSGSLAKLVKTVAARTGSKADVGAPRSTPQINAETATPMVFFIAERTNASRMQ